MRTEEEIRQLKAELEKLTGFIGEHGTDNELHNRDVQFSCNVNDALAWVLEEIQTVRFRSDDYLRLNNLKHIAKAIEIKTRESLANHK